MKKVKAEKRDQKKKPKMQVSGKSVFKIKEIILKKAVETSQGQSKKKGTNLL